MQLSNKRFEVDAQKWRAAQAIHQATLHYATSSVARYDQPVQTGAITTSNQIAHE